MAPTSQEPLTPARLVTLPTEVVQGIAFHLRSRDILSLMRTSKSLHDAAKPALYQYPSIQIDSIKPNLATFLASCSLPEQTKFHHIQGLHIAYGPFNDALYGPDVPRIASIRRLRRGTCSQNYEVGCQHGLEDMILEQIITSCPNMKDLRVEILGDLVPTMKISHGFYNLRSVFLRKLPHGYGQHSKFGEFFGQSNNDTCLESLSWVLKLPNLVEMTLDNFGHLRNVGAVADKNLGGFTPRLITLVETSIGAHPTCTIKKATKSFLAAFRKLECFQWHFSIYKRWKPEMVRWIVKGLYSHHNTLKDLTITENRHLMAFPNPLLLEVEQEEYIDAEIDLDFTPFSRLEHLLLSSKYLYDARKLPTGLEQLCIVPAEDIVQPALHLTAYLRLEDDLFNSFPDLTAKSILFLAPSRLHMGYDGTQIRVINPEYDDATYIEENFGRLPKRGEPFGGVLFAFERMVEKYCDSLQSKRDAVAEM
ncbi:hypothetical protein HDK90DRAFT_515700 [Phyllosticta capitalensis]|uniref:F-box domain-containing protein n=1 Tax=Phyllosticta capitalensis TaxID=121624 RepID=A0ABR1Y8K2_9PEZI